MVWNGIQRLSTLIFVGQSLASVPQQRAWLYCRVLCLLFRCFSLPLNWIEEESVHCSSYSNNWCCVHISIWSATLKWMGFLAVLECHEGRQFRNFCNSYFHKYISVPDSIPSNSLRYSELRIYAYCFSCSNSRKYKRTISNDHFHNSCTDQYPLHSSYQNRATRNKGFEVATQSIRGEYIE